MGGSPAKKLSFEPVGKENVQHDTPVVDELDLKKPHLEVIKKEEKPSVAPTIKPSEADEPLLQENPHRFVLFPIKYHEVREFRRVTRRGVSQSSGSHSSIGLADV